MKGQCHVVPWADDGIWLVGPAVLEPRDLNIVIGTGIFSFDIKTLEGQLDLLSCGDLEVPGLTM